MESSVQDLTALALEVGSLKASGWMESNSSVLSQIIRAIEVFLTCTQETFSRYRAISEHCEIHEGSLTALIFR